MQTLKKPGLETLAVGTKEIVSWLDILPGTAEEGGPGGLGPPNNFSVID